MKIPPALALFIMAPVIGELFSGSSPLNEFINPVTFITLALLYGCGAIIVRELLVRWNKGWPSLLLLGMAYAIYEEGQLVQSFFDPAWGDLGSLAVYGRAAGVNWVWTQHLTAFHAAFSIAASIAFVEIMFPQRRHERWVTARKWWWANWVGFVGVYVLWEIMTTYDPGLWKLVGWLSIGLLALAARLWPTPRPRPVHRTAPAPFWFWMLGFMGVFIHFMIVYQGGDEGRYPFPVAMLLLGLFDVLVVWLIRRWSGAGQAWDDRRRLALINGGLMFFLILGPLTTNGQYPVMYFSNPVFILLLWWFERRVAKRPPVGALQPGLL